MSEGLFKTIENDCKAAMKAREKERVATLRLVISALKNQQIEKREELSDEDVLGVLTSLAKQRKDSIEQFTNGGRQDLADKESAELAIISGYLPEQMGEDEVRALVTEVIAESGAQGLREMGKVMGMLMTKVKGKADGKLVNQLVRELLTGGGAS